MLILDAIQSGLGFGVLARYMLDRSLSELGLVLLLSKYRFPDHLGGIYAVYPHRNPTIVTLSDFAGSTRGFDDFGEQHHSQLYRYVRNVITQAYPADNDHIDIKTDVLTVFLIGLNLMIRSSTAEAEIDRVVQAFHAMIEL